MSLPNSTAEVVQWLARWRRGRRRGPEARPEGGVDGGFSRLYRLNNANFSTSTASFPITMLFPASRPTSPKIPMLPLRPPARRTPERSGMHACMRIAAEPEIVLVEGRLYGKLTEVRVRGGKACRPGKRLYCRSPKIWARGRSEKKVRADEKLIAELSAAGGLRAGRPAPGLGRRCLGLRYRRAGTSARRYAASADASRGGANERHRRC